MRDVVIVGGGASGMCLAIMLKDLNPKISVTVLEMRDRILKKLLVTGNGQCNITNASCDVAHYHGKTPEFVKSAFDKFPPKKQAEFFEKLGVNIVFEPDGRGYPMSYQAGSVVDCMRFSAAEKGTEIITNAEVKCVTKTSFGFEVNADKIYKTRNLVIAAGGIAGGKLGGDKGYLLLKSLGHKITEQRPSIVQVKTEGGFAKSLKGIKVNAKAQAFVNEKLCRTEAGEVLFCEYGLSGPAVMALSRFVGQQKSAEILLDLTPEIATKELENIISARAKSLHNRPLEDFFTGMLNKRLGQAVLKLSGLSLSANCGSLSGSDIKTVAANIKGLRFKCSGTTGMANAQVTAGGADTSQFFDSTMMSKKVKGLYALGEVLDIDGDCGGFNLSWCWASANAAALSIAEGLK